MGRDAREDILTRLRIDPQRLHGGNEAQQHCRGVAALVAAKEVQLLRPMAVGSSLCTSFSSV